MHKSKTPSSFPNLKTDGARQRAGRAPTPNTASGVKLVQEALLPRKAVFHIDTTIAITEALDYASVKLCDMPTGQCLVLGALAKLVATGAGGVDTITNLDVAVGTAAASNATLSGTMVNVLTKIDSAALGVVEGANSAALSVAGATPDLFLNIAVASLAVDGTVRLVGRIEVTYLELGNAAA